MSRTPMKLILTQEVTGLGAPGDVAEVAGGYGRNYLVPRGLAMPWTRGGQKQIELIKRARAARDIRGLDEAKGAAGRLASLTVRLTTRAPPGQAPGWPRRGVQACPPARPRRGLPACGHRRCRRCLLRGVTSGGSRRYC